MFHVHSWEEVNRIYCPPMRFSEIEGCTSQMFERIVCGITSVELRCRSCDDLSNRTLVGNHCKKGDKR